MFSFLIISNIDNISESIYQVFSEIGSPRKEIGGRFIVEGNGGMKDGWIAFQPIENIQYDYDVDELEEIKSRISNPSFYLIEGRNGTVDFSDIFIQKFSPSGEVLIDNDHGMIADLVKVKGRIESREDWLHLSS